MKVQLGCKDILFPVPAALIVSGSLNIHNIITVAWIGIMGSSPPVIGISLRKDRYSLELIRESKEFTVNIPQADKYIETDYCGIVSGRHRNKFNDTNFTPLKSSKISVPIIKECPFNIECQVINEFKINEWILILGNIVQVHIDEDKIETTTKNKIDISKVDPLVYCATIREYWNLGKKLGDSFEAGNVLKRSKKSDHNLDGNKSIS